MAPKPGSPWIRRRFVLRAASVRPNNFLKRTATGARAIMLYAAAASGSGVRHLTQCISQEDARKNRDIKRR
jgi:hypothetical protein